MFKVHVEIEHPERAGDNFSAYAPDLPGVVATGQTEAECMGEMREAVALHIGGMIEDGDPIPPGIYQADRADVVLA